MTLKIVYSTIFFWVTIHITFLLKDAITVPKKEKIITKNYKYKGKSILTKSP